MSSVSLNDTLTSLGLDWHYSDTGQPNLLYLVAAIDGVSCRQDKTILNINLAPSRPQLELVDRETVVRAIPLSTLLACELTATDGHTVELVHVSEARRDKHDWKPRRHPHATTHRLQLTFPSLDDAHDVSTILLACSHVASLTTPLPPLPSASPLLSATIHGQLCLHKAYIEKQSSASHLSWAKRYLLLFPNRLILYRSSTTAYPVNVLPLTVDDIDSHATVRRERGRLQLNLRQMWGLDGRELLVWKGVGVAGTIDELTKWMAAIATEQTASFRTPVSALLSPQLVSALQAARMSDERGLSSLSNSSRRSSITDMPLPPPLPPLPPSAVTAAALSSVTAGSSSSSTSPRADTRAGSFSTQFAGNPLLDGSPATYSPNASPPFNAAVFLSTLSSQLPLLHIASSTSTGRESGSAPPLSLAALLSSPRSFFHYLQHLSSLPLLFPSELPTLSGFHRVTPQPLFKKRGKLMLSIDQSLTAYHAVVEACAAVLRDSRLVMIDEFEQSGSGQIGFAYPGFDEQVFDVGRLSVVGCGQLMAGSGVAGGTGGGWEFTRSDYLCAIDSNSPAKELMQSSPDVSALYEGGEVQEAKALSTAAQRVMLHNCALAQHLKGRIGQSSRHMLAHNELVAWSTVLSSASASGTRNAAVLQSFLPCVYVTNPPFATLQQLLALHSHTAASPMAAATLAGTSFALQQLAVQHAFASAPVSPHASPDSSPLSSQPGSPKVTVGSHSRKGTALRDLWQHARRGSESGKHTEKAYDERRERTSSHSHNSAHKAHTLSAGRHTPPTSSTPPRISHPPLPSSATLPASALASALSSSPSSLAGLVCEDGSVARPLLNPLHVLLLLRCLCNARLQAIQRLEAACTEWWRKRREEKGRAEDDDELLTGSASNGHGSGSDRMDSVAVLMRKAEDERMRVLRCIGALPELDELDRQREMQEREDRDTLSRNAHMRRRQEERHDKLHRQPLAQEQHAAVVLPPPLPAAFERDSRQSSESDKRDASNESKEATPLPPAPVVSAVRVGLESGNSVDSGVVQARGSDIVGRGSIVRNRMAMFERAASST